MDELCAFNHLRELDMDGGRLVGREYIHIDHHYPLKKKFRQQMKHTNTMHVSYYGRH